jgi:hypothetical protein
MPSDYSIGSRTSQSSLILNLVFDPTAPGQWRVLGEDASSGTPSPGIVNFSPGSAGQFWLAQETMGMVCDSALADLQTLADRAGVLPDQRQTNVNVAPGFEGCGLQFAYRSSAQSSWVLTLFIWRFGAILAGDRAAHTLLPNVHVVPADEVQAVMPGYAAS